MFATGTTEAKTLEQDPIVQLVGEMFIDKHLRTEKRPVLILFVQDKCGTYCNDALTEVRRVKKKLKDKFKFVLVNLNKEPFVGAAFGVRMVPSQVIFYFMIPIDGGVGIIKSTDIEKTLNRILKGKVTTNGQGLVGPDFTIHRTFKLQAPTGN